MSTLRILDGEEAQVLFDLLLECLPQTILDLIAAGQGMRSQQVVSRIFHWLPQTTLTAVVQAWILETLGWYVDRGDIEKSKGGRYRCIPPYLVAPRHNGSTLKARLFGDPRITFSLGGAGQGIHVEMTTVSREPVGHLPGAQTSPNSPPIGIERTLHLPAAIDHREFCKMHGLGIVDLEQLAERLPKTSEVAMPAQSDLTPMPALPGIWDLYDPSLRDYDRWVPTPIWQPNRGVLLRWRPAEDQGHYNSRVFYYSGESRGVELGSELSRLWQLHLDVDAGSPRTVWSTGNQLWIPRILPVTTRQWLQGCASQTPSLRGRWLALEASASSVATILETLRSTLGFRSRTGSPPDSF